MWAENGWQGKVAGQPCRPPHRETGTSDGKQWEPDTGKGHDPVCLRKKEEEEREDQTSLPGYWVEQLAG